MPCATARTVSLHGALGHLIDVQAGVSPGQVGVTLVGRPDASLQEARDRCRMAVVNSGLPWPATRRVTVLLSPADLHKSGTHFDLAIAVAVLAAAGALPASSLHATGFLGELTLDGGLRSVTGVLPMVLAASERGVRRVFVPEPQAREAAMVPGMEVLGLRSLAQVVAELSGEPVPEAPPVAPLSGSRLLTWRGSERLDDLDLADLRGAEDAKYAVEVAAAGGHHVLLSGPKGSGKTSIAERIPTLLPPLTAEESLELSALHSLAGTLDPERGLLVEAPYAAPHHDSSKTALIGGGSGQVRPGEISRTHCGVLFLDEFPLFRADVIEALRQPMENGEVTIARRDEMVRLPARGIIALACNPCPCGEYRPVASLNDCRCSERHRRDYRAKVSGPVADRIDITRHVEAFLAGAGHDPLARSESSAVVRARVAAARERQATRYAGLGWRLNAHVPAVVLAERWPPTPEAARMVEDEVGRGRLTRRGAVRVHRLARTVADLATAPGAPDLTPGPTEVEIALRLRSGEPLPAACLAEPTARSRPRTPRGLEQGLEPGLEQAG